MRIACRTQIVAVAVWLLAGCGGGGTGGGSAGAGTVATPAVPLSDSAATEAASGAGLTLIASLVALAADPPGLASSTAALRQARGIEANATRTLACKNGGLIKVSCMTSGAHTLSSSSADDCELDDATSGLQVTYDGTLAVNIDAAGLCGTPAIPADVTRTYRFKNFQAVARQNGQIVETFTAPHLTQTIEPLADGCAGAQARLTMRGRLGVKLRDGVDVVMDASPLTLEARSDGAPCASYVVGNGRLDAADYAAVRGLRAVLDGLKLSGSAEAGYGLAGGAVVDCIGGLEFATAEPLRLAAPCATSGALRFHLPSGAAAAVRFDAGMLSIDADGDGLPERVVSSCADASLAMCRLGAGAVGERVAR